VAERIETLYIAKGNHEEFIKSLTNEQKKYVKVTDKADKSSKKFVSGLKGLAVAAIATKALKAVVSETIKFEKEMSNVKALLKPTTAEFERLSKVARELGKTTAFSATQSAEAFAELGKLGFDTNQVIAASADVLNLAAAANTDMATAAEVTAKTINQFGLEAAEAARVTDVIAKASSSSAVDIYNFQEAMKIAGATSKGMGTELEEATAAISALADGGIEGTMAGTGLSRVLLELGNSGSKVSKILQKTAPNAKTLSEKLAALKDAGLSTTQIFDAFGKIAGKSALTLINNAEKVDILADSYRDAAGAAKEMADLQLDNLAGDITLLQSVSTELAITIGKQLNPALRATTQFFTDVIADYASMINATSTAIDDVLNKNTDLKVGFESNFSAVGRVNEALAELNILSEKYGGKPKGYLNEDNAKWQKLQNTIRAASTHIAKFDENGVLKVAGRDAEQLANHYERLVAAAVKAETLFQEEETKKKEVKEGKTPEEIAAEKAAAAAEKIKALEAEKIAMALRGASITRAIHVHKLEDKKEELAINEKLLEQAEEGARRAQAIGEAKAAQREKEAEEIAVSEQLKKDALTESLQATHDITMAVSDAIAKGKMKDIDATERREIAAIKASGMNERDKQKAIEGIQAKAEKLKFDQAIKDYKRSIAMIQVDTAAGMAKTWATVGYPAAIPLTIAMGVQSTIATATAIANKPRMATGSTNAFGESSEIGHQTSSFGGTDSQLILASPDEMIIKPKDTAVVKDALNNKGVTQQQQQIVNHNYYYTVQATSLDPRSASEMILESLYSANENNLIDQTRLDVGVE